MTDEIIKVCPGCGSSLSASEIIENPNIKLLGMTFGPEKNHAMSYYFFQHEVDGCQSSFLIPVTDMLKYMNESIPETNLSESDNCENHCVNMSDLRTCSQDCTFAPFRRFLVEMFKIKQRAVKKQV